MKKIPKDEMDKLADAAFRRAARKAAQVAIQTGTPLILWKNGAIVEVDPKKMVATNRESRKNKK